MLKPHTRPDHYRMWKEAESENFRCRLRVLERVTISLTGPAFARTGLYHSYEAPEYVTKFFSCQDTERSHSFPQVPANATTHVASEVEIGQDKRKAGLESIFSQ